MGHDWRPWGTADKPVLLVACEGGSLPVVKHLINKAGADVHQISTYLTQGRTVLMSPVIQKTFMETLVYSSICMIRRAHPYPFNEAS